MGKSTEKKFFHYIKVGRVSRVRSLLENHKSFHLTHITDRRGRTPLHVCCLVGENTVMRLLLKNGADVEAVDSRGNTPVYYALEYGLASMRYSAFTDLIAPLLNICKSHILDLKNKRRKTPRELLNQLQRKFAKRWEQTEDLKETKWGTDNCETRKREDELEWERKLCFEAGQEDFAKYSQEDYTETINQETYDEWVERIIHERKRKLSAKQTTKTESKRKYQEQEQEEAKKKTRQLESEHEAFMTQMSLNYQKSKQAATLAEYEKRCCAAFNRNSTKRLKFIEVPWPCDGDTLKMINLVKIWSEGLKSLAEKKMFLKEQQIRWHPDRFLQRCGDRLDTEEREKIIEQVKTLSQEINSLLDEITA